MELTNLRIPTKWILFVIIAFVFAIAIFQIFIFNIRSQTSDKKTGEEISTKMGLKTNYAKNLASIKWAHAVNSRNALMVALNSSAEMIEADIVLGKLNNTGENLPIMAHPPAISSDITLYEFLNEIITYNNAHKNDAKGIKLDFKTIEVFEGSLEILQNTIPTMSCPIWLNADIVRGPVNETNTLPVDPERFLSACVNFDNAVLSIGWTTKWGASSTDGTYTMSEIADMLHVIKSNNVTERRQTITFPVRAGIAANSMRQLLTLLHAVNTTNKSTLTIWSSPNDYVDVEKLRDLIMTFGVHNVYLDVPEELNNKLALDAKSLATVSDSRKSLPSSVIFAVISIGLILSSVWLRQI